MCLTVEDSDGDGPTREEGESAGLVDLIGIVTLDMGNVMDEPCVPCNVDVATVAASVTLVEVLSVELG